MTMLADSATQVPSNTRPGYFGPFGGQFVPETLMPAINELEEAYARVKDDPAFRQQLAHLNATYVGRPTPLYEAKHLTEHLRQGAAQGYGARIFLKREDLAHTGAHKINNAVGQGLLAQRMGKKRIIAETGAGQHGVAAATVCAMLGLTCIVYMGEEDIQRQSLNVFRMKLLGTEVRSVRSGTQTLKDAVNEAIRDWVTNVRDTYYMIGSAIGPHPYPTIVRDFQAIIGEETRAQAMAQIGALPDYVVACVGGGSNAIGIFYPFAADPTSKTKLIGVEAGGRGIATGAHAATLVAGDVGVLHGARMYLLQDADGQIMGTHSISAGLDYPGVGPEHSYYKQTGRAEYVAANDDETVEAVQLLCRTEGILPALESAHAVAYVRKLAPTLPADATIVINLSGRGDKDINTLIQTLGVELSS